MKNRWIWRRLNSAGYGVQSPNDFYFVQHVLREKAPYYAYAVLKELHEQYAACLPCYPEAVCKLLFRLTNHVHPSRVIEVGSGLSSLVMAMACPTAQVVSIASSSLCSEAMQPLMPHYPQMELKTGDEMVLFCQSLHTLGPIGMLHVAHTPHYREVVDAALPQATDHSLFVIEGIRESKEKLAWWNGLMKSHSTGICYDLGLLGLIFFDRSRHKETYWIKLRN